MSFQSRDRLSSPAVPPFSAAEPRASWVRRVAGTLGLWRERVRIRRSLAGMDARSLRDAGISPAAAAYESGKPFWQEIGGLR